jgi:hypothetical protein
MAEETEKVVSEQTTDQEVEKVEQSTTDEQQSQESQEEPTFEVDGEKLTASEIKELRKNFKNDSEWKKENTRKSQEIAAKEKELAPLLMIPPEQRMEILQKLYQPKQERNIDAELDQLYTQKPDVYDTVATAQWERQKDVLIATKIATDTQKTILQQSQMSQAVVHNDEIYNSAKEQFKDKVSDMDFQGMTDWIKQNVMPNQGKYPKNAFDIAYKALHEDKWLEEKMLATTKKVVKQIEKVGKVSASVTGSQKTETETLEDWERQAADGLKARRMAR